MAPGWPISSSTLWSEGRIAGRHHHQLLLSHHLKLSQKPGEGLQGQARRAVGALQMDKAGDPAEPSEDWSG